MLSSKAALGLCVIVMLSACGTRAAVETATPRALRVSMRPTEILSAFLKLPQFSVQVVTIGDARKRLEALQGGSVDVANVVADVTYAAFYGGLPGHPAPLQNIRGIALWSRAVVHVLIGPGVDSSRGFRGMRVVFGDPTGGNSALGERLVNSTGVSTSAVTGEFAAYDIAVDKLLKGEVDAVIATVSPPQDLIARALRGGARLLEIKGPEVDRLRIHYPLLRRTLLSRGTYPGQDSPLHTVGVDLLLVCRADLDTELVYELTRVLFEEIPRHVRRRVDPHRAPATVIPLHPGAARVLPRARNASMTSSRIVAFAARAWNLLTILVFVGVTALLVSGYRAARDWERGVSTRIAHQTEESADLIIKAISRDMHGVQAMILANRDWDAPLPYDTADLDMTEQVATTFARYPYPESFFTWRGGNYGMIFFSRSTRLPSWMPNRDRSIDSPIAVVIEPIISEHVRQRLLSSIAAQQRYAVFHTEFNGVPYQIVARVNYADPLREQLESVRGFTVNLDWVRTQYFADILRDIGPSASGGLTQDVALLDNDNRPVFGSRNDAAPIAERMFPLLFMDSSDTASDLPPDVNFGHWKLRVSSSRDPMLLSAHRRADTTLVAIAVALVVCGISLVLARRTVLSDAKLSEMRSRFVSSVTHDLKTPLANIHALSATLERESQVTSERYRAYPHLLMQEATNLSRQVDNLLAYARITDVTETYAFEPMAAAELVDEAVKGFQPRLGENGVRVDVDLPEDLPFVRADQRAMVLALKNLIDNGLRHARNGEHGHLRIAVRRVGENAHIEVQDNGCGISPKKLAALRDSIASRAFAPADGGGLGVAIASKVVADHGGTLTVDSTLGMGTRCVIGLPVC